MMSLNIDELDQLKRERFMEFWDVVRLRECKLEQNSKGLSVKIKGDKERKYKDTFSIKTPKWEKEFIRRSHSAYFCRGFDSTDTIDGNMRSKLVLPVAVVLFRGTEFKIHAIINRKGLLRYVDDEAYVIDCKQHLLEQVRKQIEECHKDLKTTQEKIDRERNAIPKQQKDLEYNKSKNFNNREKKIREIQDEILRLEGMQAQTGMYVQKLSKEVTAYEERIKLLRDLESNLAKPEQ